MKSAAAWIASILAGALLGLAGGAAWGGEQEDRSVKIDGRDLTCTDYRGRPVRTYTVAGLGDAGFSEIFFRVPVIKLDPDILDTLPGKLQVFFFLHECGHHKLGHLASGIAGAETEADCWAAKTGRDTKAFNRDDVVAFGRYIAASGASRAGHLPGPQRHAFVLDCFDDTSAPPAP